MLALILWGCVALNLLAFTWHLKLRRKLKVERGRDAELLAMAAHIVRSAGRGDYVDGEVAMHTAEALDAQATRALIIGGHMDKERRAWLREMREHGPDE